LVWVVLIFVLIFAVFSKMRYETAAIGGLFVLGLLGISPPSELFSGFSNPALFTVIIVLVMSEGIVESGILTGLGKSIASKIHNPEKQILAVSISTWLLSAFMNNVGAIGLILPTSRRMAARAGIDKARFGMPIPFASILGGSVTLIGTASNLIVSTFRLQASGKPFNMFDFAAHGLAMSLAAFALWFISRIFRNNPKRRQKEKTEKISFNDEELLIPKPEVKRSKKNTLIVLITLIPAIVLTGTGIIHPSVAFGIVVLLWLAAGIFKYNTAIRAINIPILLFLGSMLSISAILDSTGALPDLVGLIIPFVATLPSFWLILAFLFITAVLANIINNSVAAVLMAPAAILLYQSGAITVKMDALLMAVAAGASLGLVMPTHQTTIVAMNSMGFKKMDFIRKGALIALVSGITASIVIYFIWNKTF